MKAVIPNGNRLTAPGESRVRWSRCRTRWPIPAPAWAVSRGRRTAGCHRLPGRGRATRGGCLCQVLGEAVEHLGRAFPAQLRRLRPVEAVEVGALLGPRQRRAAGCRGELYGGDGDGDARSVGVHLIAVDDPLAWDDVVVAGVVAVADALVAEAGALAPAGPEVELRGGGVRARFGQVARIAPGFLGFLRGEGGEHACRGHGVSPLDHERVVDDGPLSHGI